MVDLPEPVPPDIAITFTTKIIPLELEMCLVNYVGTYYVENSYASAS